MGKQDQLNVPSTGMTGMSPATLVGNYSRQIMIS
jgi:hypothetical protein